MHNSNHEQSVPPKRGAASVAPSARLLDQGKILKQDAGALAASVQESAQLLSCYVAEQVEERPYTTLGVAAGIGYMLGGGLANRLTSATLGIAYRLGLALAAREIGTRLMVPGLTGKENSAGVIH